MMKQREVDPDALVTAHAQLRALRAELAALRKAAEGMREALDAAREMCAAAGYEVDNGGMRTIDAALAAYDATTEGA